MKNYIELAKRTMVETPPHCDLVDEHNLKHTIANSIVWLERLDVLKKALYYGKTTDFCVVTPIDSCTISGHCDGVPVAQLTHGIIGVATEAAELLQNFSVDLDKTNILEEVGDVMWYLALILDAIGSDFDEAMVANIAKLQARYPDKFSDDKAILRDIVKERAVLDMFNK